jgi:MFS family permease
MPSSAQDATAVTDNRERRIFIRAAWRILPVLMFAFLFAYVDRVNVGFAQLQMAGDLGFSNSMYGFGAGIFFLGYFIFEIPSNLILDKVGARLWIGRIMLTWGIISGLTAFVTTPMQFYLMRFALGVAEAGLIPGIIYYTSNWFPGHWRGRIWGVFYIALASSGLVGGPMSGVILSFMSGLHGVAGWKWLFIIEAIPSVIGGFLVLLVLPDRVAGAKWLTDEDKRLVVDLLARERQDKPHISMVSVFMNPWIILLTTIYFLMNLAIYAIQFWTPTLIKAMGEQSTLTIGLLTALPSLCTIATLLVIGRTADHFRERRWHLITLFLIATTGLVLSVVFQHHVLFGVASLCLVSMGTLTVPSMFWSVPTAMLEGTVAAAGIALINSVGNLSGFFGPFIIGAVKDAMGSADNAILFLAAMMVLNVIMVACLPSRFVKNLGTG